MTKPFGMAELVARIRALLRRASVESTSLSEVLRAGDVTLDRQTRQVTVGTRKVELTSSEFDLLTVLLTAPGSGIFLLSSLVGVILVGLFAY